MKHMIFCTPKVEMQLASFKGDESLINEVKGYINSQFNGFSTVRITSDSGNGSSFLLHAIGNEFRKAGNKFSFLHFTEEDKFEDLTKYHLSDILSRPIVFIDNVHFVLEDFEQKEKFGAFLKELGERNGKLIYACRKEDRLENQLFVNKSFSDSTLNFYLEPILNNQRKVWATEKLNEYEVGKIPEELFSIKNSNSDFLKSLQPYIDEYNLDHGMNYKEIREIEESLYHLEVRILRNRLAILELEPVKNIVIKEQKYEKAADIREQQNVLSMELNEIRNELDAFVITPKPSESAMRLYIHYISLQNTFKVHEESLFYAIELMRNKLDQLNIKKKELDIESEKDKRLQVFREIVNWTNTLNRFFIK
jgi:hypothetical protein